MLLQCNTPPVVPSSWERPCLAPSLPSVGAVFPQELFLLSKPIIAHLMNIWKVYFGWVLPWDEILSAQGINRDNSVGALEMGL